MRRLETVVRRGVDHLHRHHLLRLRLEVDGLDARDGRHGEVRCGV